MPEPSEVPNDPRLYRRVYVWGIKEYGEVRKVRLDDRNEPIFTVNLDHASATPDGLMYAREFELIWL